MPGQIWLVGFALAGIHFFILQVLMPCTGRSGVGMVSRLQHLDVAKGIGIAFVVLGHNWITLDEKGELFRVIFSFHMPLFFFLSGILFKPAQPLGDLVRSKAQSLLKPYALASLISLTKVFSWLAVLATVYATGDWLPWVPLWFLPHLFLVFVVAWGLVRLTGFDRLGPWAQAVMLLVLLCAGYAVLPIFWNLPVSVAGRELTLPGLPWCADVVLVTVSFFLAGFALREKVLAFSVQWWRVLVAALLFAGLHARFNMTIDLNERLYDNLLVSTLEAASGIYLVLAASVMMLRWGRVAGAVAYVGRGSLFVFMFHPWFQDHVFRWVDNHVDGMDGLSVLLSFLAGLLLPLVVWEMIKRNRWLAWLWLPVRNKGRAV